MKLASVILDIQTQALESPYTYALSASDGGGAEQGVLFSDEELGFSDPVLAELASKGYAPVVGAAVLVPLGRRKVVGFIVAVHDCAVSKGVVTVPSLDDSLDPQVIPVGKLKRVIAVLSEPYFSEEGAACAFWLARRYVAPLSSCVRLFVPPAAVPRVVRDGSGWRLEKPVVGEVDDRWVTLGPRASEVTLRKGAAKQERIMQAVRAGDVRMSELATEFGSISSSIKSLEKKGAIVVERRRRMRDPFGEHSRTGDRALPSCAKVEDALEIVPVCPDNEVSSLQSFCEQPCGLSYSREAEGSQAPSLRDDTLPVLTQGQVEALREIEKALTRHDGSVVVVDGVTGSGKTEVYLRAIQGVIASGRTAIVLVPEISLTPQTVGRFRRRFGDAVAVMHSRMSAGERYDQWSFIRTGSARVVVGARSALFTPLRDVGLIVIDEEHEGSYKQDSAPRYNARDVAIWMMGRTGGAVALGSATPAITTLYAASHDHRWSRAALPERANRRPLPPITVVDMAKEFGSGHRSMFSRELTESLRTELLAGHKAVMLLNQRGFAKFLLCRDCGFVPECPHCSTSLTFHERGNFLMCHHCGYRVVAPPVCPSCGSPYLKKFGAGTQRVEDELASLIGTFDAPANSARIVRMDADTTSGKGAHQRLLDEFATADHAVLLGTQMIAKGLDFDDVTLVGVINADTQLHLPDYRAGERTFDLIQQVAGRAGRANLPGHVIVQTYEADNIAVCSAARYDRSSFLDYELPKRQALGYPPFQALANVLVWGKSDTRVEEVAVALHRQILELVRDRGVAGWTVMPAAPCLLAKLRNTFRWHVLIKAPANADIGAVLGPLFRTRTPEPDVNVAVDIDPEDLL